MATEIRIWEISGPTLRPVEEVALSANHLEKELENWIATHPDILGEKLLVIDRQRDIPTVGRLDLLCIDEEGRLVIVELKRDRTPREAVAQALDYASWLDSEEEETINSNARDYLKRPLADAFSDCFQTELPEFTCQNHRIVLVAPRLDASAERIINYLSERHSIDINAVFFKYAKLSGGEILARSFLVADEARPKHRGRMSPSLDQLMAMAAERKTIELVEICRRMGESWEETCSCAYNGSLRYWASTSAGPRRMVFGVNVFGKNNPPSGQLDIWISMRALAESSNIPETEIRKSMKENHPVLDLQVVDCWLRLKEAAQAESIVERLKSWALQSQTAPSTTGC